MTPPRVVDSLHAQPGDVIHFGFWTYTSEQAWEKAVAVCAAETLDWRPIAVEPPGQPEGWFQMFSVQVIVPEGIAA